MRPVIRRLHSPDVFDLQDYQPDDPQLFGFLLQVMYGPEDRQGEESFDIVVCTPAWLASEVQRVGILSGRHYLFMCEYDFERLRAFLTSYAENCHSGTWEEVAMKLARLGKWEFEDYRELNADG